MKINFGRRKVGRDHRINGELGWVFGTHPDGGIEITLWGLAGRPKETIHITEKDLRRMVSANELHARLINRATSLLEERSGH